jgi:GABA(A) receptor-associated protein
MNFEFKKKSFEARLAESIKIKKKYSDRIPVIIEKHISALNIAKIDKSKYLVPSSMTLGQFLLVIRNRIKLGPEQSIFFFINNGMQPFSSTISELYNNFQDKDGFLYLHYASENTFG